MNVALLGLGIVGQGVYDIIKNDFPDIHIKAILVKNKDKHQDVKSLLVNTLSDILNDDDIELVIECLSGKRFAYDAVKQVLKRKKHVITANKAVMSDYFKELIDLAKENNVQLRYEASVAAAVIVLDSMVGISKVNHVHQIEGILNGSTNYILSRVFLNDLTIDQAIQEANDKGYLETGSDDDMNGLDPLRKINILSMIAYHTSIDEKAIMRIPLTSVTQSFIDEVKAKGLLIKFIGRSKLIDQTISIIVEPIIIDKNTLLSNINYEENIISVYGQYHKKQTFTGQGAGRYPTAQAMIYDLQKIIENQVNDLSFSKNYQFRNEEEADFLIQNKQGEIYIKNTSYQDLKNDQNIICFARMDVDKYESL